MKADIIIEVQGIEHRLTLEEARKLREVLDGVLGRRVEVQKVIERERAIPLPAPNRPWWYQGQITCDSTERRNTGALFEAARKLQQ